MNIRLIELFPLLYPLPKPYGDANGLKKHRSCLLFRLTTELGLTGWGECVDWLPTIVKGFEDRIIPYLLGKSVADRQQLLRTVSQWHPRAAAGLSMAFSEIVAQHARISITDLWGGRWRHRIPVYASFQSYSEESDWMNSSLRLVEQRLMQGFSKAKVKIGGKTIREDQGHISALQSQFSQVLELALDANQSYDAAAAGNWRALLQRWDNLMWLEELLPMHRQEQYRQIKSWLPLPCSGGENLSAPEFIPLLGKGTIDILQPDPMHQTSIQEYVQLLFTARQFGQRVSPHTFDGSLSRLYALFAQACLPPWSKMTGEEIEPVEWDAMENPLTQLFPVPIQQGEVVLPTGAGLGTAPDMERIRSLLWDGHTY